MKRSAFILLNLLIYKLSLSQISFTAPDVPYSQNFNGISITGTDGSTQAWSNNSTLTGWYVQQGSTATTSIRLELSPTTSLQNTGSPYIIKNGTDISIGSRASGTSPNNNIYIGARFKNNTGVTLNSLKVEYYGEQYSIAENNGNVNNLAFHYQIVCSPGTITSLTAGSWTAMTALNFTQIFTHSDSPSKGGTACTGTSNQCLGLDGNAVSNRISRSLSFNLTLNPGDEIMLRWYDADNTSNDHHLQIDDVIVTPDEGVVLPMELLDFSATCQESLSFHWETVSERDNNYFTIEATNDGKNFKELAKIEGEGNSYSSKKYDFTTENFTNEFQYYRLRQTDFDGNFSTSDLLAIQCQSQQEFTVYPNPSNNGTFIVSGYEKNTRLLIYDELGRLIFADDPTEFSTAFDFSGKANGIYMVKAVTADQIRTKKVIVQK